jgi:hypothetical protein
MHRTPCDIYKTTSRFEWQAKVDSAACGKLGMAFTERLLPHTHTSHKTGCDKRPWPGRFESQRKHGLLLATLHRRARMVRRPRALRRNEVCQGPAVSWGTSDG